MYKALLIDPDETTLNNLKEILNNLSHNIEIITATQGQHAISILQNNQIDFITTNSQLPDIDVLDLFTYINNNFPNTKLFILTEPTQQDAENLDTVEFIRLIHKPLNSEQVNQTYSELLDKKINEESVLPYSLGAMLQLVEINERSCLIGVKSSQTNHSGKIYIKNGVPHAALFGKKKGEEAIYDMMDLSEIHLDLRKPPTKRIKKNIHKTCTSLLLEGSRRLHKSAEKEALYTEMNSLKTDENSNNVDDVLTEADFFTSQSTEVEASDSTYFIKGDEQIQEINEILENFKIIEGLEAVAVLTPEGEVAAQLNPGNLSLQEMAALANEVLLKSQKGSEAMNLGRGSMVHIDAPKGEIICRCLNEGTDFAATSSGRAHIHLIVVLDKEGGLAMAKMKAENAIRDLAQLFR